MIQDDNKPEVLSSRTVIASLVLHVAVVLLIVLFGSIKFKKEEQLIPIDLSIVVNENLDGEENQPPPLQDPPPEPKEEPLKMPVKQVELPPPVEVQKDIPAVIKEQEKPKKTKEQIIKERMQRIRDNLKKNPDKPKAQKEKVKTDNRKRILESLKPTNKKVEIKVDAQSGNGRTDKRTLSRDEINRLLNLGYKPGTKNQLSQSESQRCISLIYNAFYSKWQQRPAWNKTLKPMHLKISLGLGGKITSYSLVGSSGDPAADKTVLNAASLVRSVAGLSAEFIRQHRSDIIIRFEVTSQ